jgi:cell wall-associated NlpC family hydrolase
MARPSSQLFCLAYVAWGLMLQGCASAPPVYPSVPQSKLVLPAPGIIETPMPTPQSVAEASVGSEIVIRAVALLGSPYKWGGSGPLAFDCSGLVRYLHHEVGIEVPRTALEQYMASTPVSTAKLEPGDLLFFRTRGRNVSHVAIYAGSGRFVHAPQTGRSIELGTLDDGYYGARFVAAGRLF